MAKRESKKGLFIALIYFLIITGLGIFSGYFVGNIIASKYFSINKYEDITTNMLRDDLSKINYKNKTPDQFDSAIAFQIAEQVMIASTKYEARGTGLIKTSIGVDQVSTSIDTRDGDDLYFGFTTYSSLVKVSKQSNYKIGGPIKIQDGTPTDGTIENVNWQNKYNEYTWDEYYDVFGKYANYNCCVVVSSKTVSEDLGVEKDGDLYKFSVVLDPGISTVGYVKQVGNNAGINPCEIVFHEINLTFWIDKDFRFVKQVKYESYTLPYGGIDVILYVDNEMVFEIE